MWLKDFDWQALIDKKLVAPYKPEQNQENFDKQQANNLAAWKEDTSAEQLRENQLLLKRPSIQELFDGYYFDHLQREESSATKPQA